MADISHGGGVESLEHTHSGFHRQALTDRRATFFEWPVTFLRRSSTSASTQDARRGFDVTDTRVRSHRGKRAFDLAIGLPLAVVLTPVMIVMAIGSVISYRAWPLFSQVRLGKNGAEFNVLKIRSLPVHTPANLAKHYLNGCDNNWWGRTIRKFHLDEIPQLWHVVSGTMSLVGPRPEMPKLSDTFDPNFVRQRLRVAPGCTGLWQISAASNGLIGDDTTFDLHYITHRTLRLDMWILMRTACVMAGRKAIHSTGEIPRWTGTTG